MDYNFFTDTKLSDSLLDQFSHAQVNVLLVGEKGSGKSERMIQAMARAYGTDFAYLSGSTIDPWTDVVGVPTPVTFPNGDVVLKYARPDTIPDTTRAIILDEANRSHPKVRNALMELIQFKSINGRKYPNLECVWAACNPWNLDGERSDYDADRLDPAFMDRFQVIVRVGHEPDPGYFGRVYGRQGEDAVAWWRKLPTDATKNISARRLAESILSHRKGLDLKFVLPFNSNYQELMKTLSMDELSRWYDVFERSMTAYTKGSVKSLTTEMMNSIKELAEPGEKHAKYFDKALKQFPDFGQMAKTFMNGEQKRSYASKGYSYFSDSVSGITPVINDKPFANGYINVDQSGTLDAISNKTITTAGGTKEVVQLALQKLIGGVCVVRAKLDVDVQALILFGNDTTTTKFKDAVDRGLLVLNGDLIDFNNLPSK